MKYSLAALLLFKSGYGLTQETGVSAMNGNLQTFTEFSAHKVNAGISTPAGLKSGTIYFSDRWQIASVTLLTDQNFENIPVKLDLLNGVLLYNVHDTAYTPVVPVGDVFIRDSNTGKRTHFVHANRFLQTYSQVEDGWYELLAGATHLLYKKVRKKIVASREYSSATTTYNVESVIEYFVSKDKKLFAIKKWKNLEAIFPGDKIKTLIAQEKTSKSKYETGLISIIDKYDTVSMQ